MSSTPVCSIRTISVHNGHWSMNGCASSWHSARRASFVCELPASSLGHWLRETGSLLASLAWYLCVCRIVGVGTIHGKIRSTWAVLLPALQGIADDICSTIYPGKYTYSTLPSSCNLTKKLNYELLLPGVSGGRSNKKQQLFTFRSNQSQVGVFQF